jgi:hypothetical protein
MLVELYYCSHRKSNYFNLIVVNAKFTIPLIAKDGSKSGELKVLVNGTIERTRRRNSDISKIHWLK